MRSSGQITHPRTNIQVVRTNVRLDLSPNKPFVLPKRRNFKPQYANVYFSRLRCLSPAVLSTAKLTFGQEEEGKLHYASRISDVAAVKDVDVVAVGVVFRHMSSKPSILAQYELPSHDLIPAPPSRSTKSYVGEDDVIYFEDGFGRCALDLSALEPDDIMLSFASGFVLALKGREDHATGSFKVTAFAHVGPAPQKPLADLGTDKYVCLVSTLSLGKNNALSIGAELLMEFLAGNSGDDEEVANSCAIVQLIIAGNLVPAMENTDTGASAVLQPHRPVHNGEKRRMAGSIRHVDRLLSALAVTIPVAVMPGEADPVNYLLPQQPYHQCLLPTSSRHENLTRVTNPFACSLDERDVLGTAGQNVLDLALYEKTQDEKGVEGSEGASDEPSAEKVLDILELLLKNRHIAPTCPDTLASYPFTNGKDPFVLNSTPHIFFAGGQKEFGSRLVQLPTQDNLGSSLESMGTDGLKHWNKVRLVSVPRFDETGWAILVNLRTLDIVIREFGLEILG